MNKAIIFTLICVSLASIAQGQFLQNKIVKATKPIDKECLALLDKPNKTQMDNCNFYKCFEERFPCGSEYWIINWGYKYCSRYANAEFSAKFTENGQKLLAHVNECLPQSLKRAYKRPSQNCKRLQLQAFESQGRCYKKELNLFCKAFPDNKDLFSQVLDQSDFFNMDSVSMIKKVVGKCRPKIDMVKLMFPDGL